MINVFDLFATLFVSSWVVLMPPTGYEHDVRLEIESFRPPLENRMNVKYLLPILLCAVSTHAAAGVINSADVGGYSTFTDTQTGRVWLDMDNFFDAASNNGTSGFDMITAAQSAGFTFATRSDVEALLNTLPLSGGEWATYAPVMGYGIPRELIWGMYDDSSGNPYGFAWLYSSNASWNYQDDFSDANTISNQGIDSAVDMGIWAYQNGVASVPEPSTIVMLGLGAMGLAYRTRRKARA